MRRARFLPTIEQLAELREFWASTNRVEELADRWGVAVWQVTDKANSMGLGKRPHRDPVNRLVRDEDLRRCVEMGMTPLEAARYLNASRNTIYRHAQRLGLKLKMDSERRKVRKIVLTPPVEKPAPQFVAPIKDENSEDHYVLDGRPRIEHDKLLERLYQFHKSPRDEVYPGTR